MLILLEGGVERSVELFIVSGCREGVEPVANHSDDEVELVLAEVGGRGILLGYF